MYNQVVDNYVNVSEYATECSKTQIMPIGNSYITTLMTVSNNDNDNDSTKTQMITKIMINNNYIMVLTIMKIIFITKTMTVKNNQIIMFMIITSNKH